MERIYLDSVVLIYLVEQCPPWFTRIRTRLTTASVQIVVSDLTRMECRVKPLAVGDTVLLAAFDAAFGGSELAPITSAVFDRATRIRAVTRFKTPDSIHLAAALESGCDVFLTNDTRLSAFTDIAVEIV
jgi:uncharacterized protein